MIRMITIALAAMLIPSLVSAQSPYDFRPNAINHRYSAYDAPHRSNYANIGLRNELDYRQRPAIRSEYANNFSNYRPDQAYGGRCASRSRGYGQVPYTQASYGQLPYGHQKRALNTQRILADRDKYVKNNLYGDDTIFDRDQPVRNAFRYLFP